MLPLCKHYDTWDVKCLALLQSLAPSFSLTNSKPAWKTATLLAFLQENICSDLAVLCIDSLHLFLQHHAAIFIPAFNCKTDELGHLPPEICIESHLNVKHCPVFSLKVYLCCTEPFRKKSDGSCLSFLFWGNNRQHMPVSAKIVSSRARKVLSIVKTHMSLGSI